MELTTLASSSRQSARTRAGDSIPADAYSFKLHVREGLHDYDVMAELVGLTAENFDIEVSGQQVMIRVDPLGDADRPAGLCLVFSSLIDSSTSTGEFDDGSLHLHLRKRRATASKAHGTPRTAV